MFRMENTKSIRINNTKLIRLITINKSSINNLKSNRCNFSRSNKIDCRIITSILEYSMNNINILRLITNITTTNR